MRAAFSSTPIRAGTWCSLAAFPRATARSMIPQHSSQVIFKMLAAPEMSVSFSTSMAKRSKAVVKRLRGSAQGRRTWRTPSVGHLTRGGRAWSQVGNPPVSRWRQARFSEWSKTGQLGLALRAGPQPALVVRDGDVDPLVLDREVDVLDVPGVSEPEDLGVELDVAHRRLLGLPAAPGQPPGATPSVAPCPALRHRRARCQGTGDSPSENRSVSGGSQRPMTSVRGRWPPIVACGNTHIPMRVGRRASGHRVFSQSTSLRTWVRRSHPRRTRKDQFCEHHPTHSGTVTQPGSTVGVVIDRIKDMDRWLGDGGMELIGTVGATFVDYGVDGEDLGWVTGTFVPTELACNPHGVVQAGVHGLLLDAAMNFAINAALGGRDRTRATLEMKVETMRPASVGQPYRLRGEVVRMARQVAYAEGTVIDEADEMVSRSTGTFLLHRHVDKEPDPG